MDLFLTGSPCLLLDYNVVLLATAVDLSIYSIHTSGSLVRKFFDANTANIRKKIDGRLMSNSIISLADRKVENNVE
jgi:hypothetical protein